MNFIDLAKKHLVVWLVLLLVLGCSFDLGKQRTSETKTGERRNTKTKPMDDEIDEERPTRTNKDNGNVPQELAGKWCYLANVQANDGGRMSERCFTLYENGTYEYYAETNSTNPYGGSSSQSRDSGRWSATATTITARSNNGQTYNYTLEKRNHPKTGDPMLVVDGDAFVTAYQKQPW